MNSVIVPPAVVLTVLIFFILIIGSVVVVGVLSAPEPYVGDFSEVEKPRWLPGDPIA